MPDTPILQVENLSKFFPVQRGLLRRTVGHVKAINDVSFTVNKGECVGLVGESGCGKTTVARCLLRLVEPDQGRILLHGEQQTFDIASKAPRSVKLSPDGSRLAVLDDCGHRPEIERPDEFTRVLADFLKQR